MSLQMVALTSQENTKLDEMQKIPGTPPVLFNCPSPPHLGGFRSHDGTVLQELLCPSA